MMLFRALALAGLAAAGGCSLFENNAPAAAVDINTVANPVDLRIGDTARVAIEITNVSRDTVLVGVSGCNLDFVLTDSRGRSYHPYEYVYCTLELRAPIRLAAGATHTVEGFTTGRVIPEGSQDAGFYVSPGTYRIQGRVGVIRGNEAAITVTSRPASVTFRARE